PAQSDNDDNFIPVGARNRRAKRNVNNTVVGRNESRVLDIIANLKWVHLSYFNTTVSSENIMSYVHEHAAIDKSDLRCYALVKKDAEINGLRRVSFKLGVANKYYGKIFDTSLWQEDIR
ncbi:uncharacterized protein LOC118756110, partial [Rhagoletis pomonella]|uniref:uncharacterized protein LOC118756110 n=1 Tax=Rhagoletis pomonella TaxID=28610 RepID=UPI00177F7557